MKNTQKGIYFRIGKLKSITDEGRPVMTNTSWSSKKSKITRDAQVSLKKYGKPCLKVSYGKFKNADNKLVDFHNWAEFDTINSFKSYLREFTNKDLIAYIQS